MAASGCSTRWQPALASRAPRSSRGSRITLPPSSAPTHRRHWCCTTCGNWAMQPERMSTMGPQAWRPPTVWMPPSPRPPIWRRIWRSTPPPTRGPSRSPARSISSPTDDSSTDFPVEAR
ncbi:hypothetical protein BALAC2494_02054 [Bifidobacterium animalis subsp. lactis CNCM I-2494]|uniref:Uncharacterized protein n=1 Tax=Bifidobacterium animalis subsp. lactis CNCM I-2494 TaxID=1042403 RepID=A0A806FU99_BIFAN|nr:hypothetical protein BALAC2494_02054 [Bifidobacterium animalis subsp. lactis CNCM I-2494]